MVTGTGNFVIGHNVDGVYEKVIIEEGKGTAPVVSVINSRERPIFTTSDDETFAAFGELLVAEFTPQTAWRFDYGVNLGIVNTSGTMNGGAVSGSFSRAELSTYTNASGSAQVQTHKYLRYLPGLGGLYRGTTVFASGTPNSEQGMGIIDSQDGLAFGYNGEEFGILVRRNSIDSWTPQSQWNGDALSDTLIPQFGNIYQIRFQWLGYGLLKFYIFDKLQRKYVNVHTVRYPNTSPLTHILNPTLPVTAWIKNKGNNTNLVLYTPSAVGGLEGHPASDYSHPLNVYNSYDLSVAISNTNNNHVISLKNNTLLNGVKNKVAIQINSIQAYIVGGGAPVSTLRLYRNANTAIARTYTDINPGNSPIAVSTTTTTITSSNPERAFILSSSIPINQSFLPGEFVIDPEEILTIGAQNSSAAGTTLVLTINWSELF